MYGWTGKDRKGLGRTKALCGKWLRPFLSVPVRHGLYRKMQRLAVNCTGKCSALKVGLRHLEVVFLSDGGRVLGVTALGDTLADAKVRAYEAVACIQFRDAMYRRDIADKALLAVATPPDTLADKTEPRP